MPAEAPRPDVTRSRALAIHYNVYYFGGAEYVCIRMLRALQQRFSEVVLLHAGGPLDAARIEAWSGVRLDPARVRFETVGWPNWLRRLARLSGVGHQPILLQYALVLRAARSMTAGADLVITTEGECTVSAASAIQYIHYPMFFHDRESLAHLGASDLGTARWLVRSCYVLLARRVAGWRRSIVASHLTLANSEWTAAEFRRRYKGSNPQVLHAGAAVSLHPRSPEWVPFAQREDNFVILGRLVPSKRIEEAVEIIRRLRARGWELGLLIVGNDPGTDGYAARIDALLADKPWAQRHVGLSRREVERLVVRQKWGLHCYQFEHYGIGPAELQLLGCIVFVHDSGGQREIIANPAQRYTDLDDAVEKIDAVLSAPATHPGLLQKAQASSAKHTAEAFERRISQLIDEVMASTSFGKAAFRRADPQTFGHE